MNRRNFLKQVGYAISLPVAMKSLTATAKRAEDQCTQTFAYYQGLGPDEERSPSRPDGTEHNMPCLPIEDISIGEPKSYKFWHGHGGEEHSFSLSEGDFKRLTEGEDIEVYTSIINGHRHALKVNPIIETV